jgi:RND family efflux transporter MFP subunit
MMIVLILGMWGCASNNEENATEEIEIVAVERGSLVTAVSCSGRVQPRTEVSLGFGIGGRINEVAVEAGSHVEAGDILARLDTTDLEFEVQSAAAALASAQAQLAQVKAGARPEEIAAAEAQYRSALAQYRKVRTGPSEEELTIAEADLKKAQAALEQAQAAYDPISWRPDAGLFPQALNLEQATLSYRQALANYELVKKGAASEDKEVAWRNAENAEAQLDMLRAGPTPEQIAVAEVAVEQAEIALEAARYQLTKATLVAPRAGIVDQIGIDAGEFVAPQAPVITLIDDEEFRIEADIDEIDVGWVEPGQKVRVTLDAFPGRTLEGKIVRIATTANADAGGVISYRATVSVAPQTLPIRGGMTANTEIVRDSAEDVLLIPNRAIWIDTDTGKPFVEKLVGEEIVITSIEQGLANEEMSEITRGLEDGEKLVVRDVSIRERFRNVVTTSMTGD